MRVVFILLCFIFTVFKGFGWNGQAHMTIAAIAWDRLTDEEKTKVTALLEKHPQFEVEWEDAYVPYKELLPLGKYLMMRASMWPDEIKNKSNINFTYSRLPWHYINQKLYFDRPIDENNPEVVNEKGEENVVWAINHSIHSFESNEMTAHLKAVYFSWLIHLTADIHQPLHACALYDKDKLKKGDRGGNEIYITTATDTTDLQSFWDDLLGEKNDVKKALQLGFIFRKKLPFTEEYISEMNPEVWAKQSYSIAKNKAYLNGKLRYSFHKKNVAPQVPDTYVEEAKNIAMNQVTLAGYRLAHQISQLVK